MRLAAQEKMGFYAAHPEAIAELAKHLTTAGSSFILDPCAGEGEAIKQIADSIAVPHEQVYCIELDDARGNTIRNTTMPDIPTANVLSPCSFFSTSMVAGSFGLIYCNPPFDNQLGGGGREEVEFARHCYRLLVPGGILVLIAPFSAFSSSGLPLHLDTHYKDAAIYKFPEGHRPYHECAFIGVKRNVSISGEKASDDGLLMSATRIGVSYGGPYTEHPLAELGQQQAEWVRGRKGDIEQDLRIWTVPTCRQPSRFAKAGYTDTELIEVVAASSINKLVLGVETPKIKEPPLPLERGHVAMLLAAGALDGLVETPDGNHVVRGVAFKVEVYNEDASDYTISDDGKTAKIKEVYSQQITLRVRALDASGTIYTFTTDSASASGADDEVTVAEVGYKDWDLIQKLKMITTANGATEGEEQAARSRLRAVMDRVSKNHTTKTGTSG